jgi:hypothetical protein
MLILKGLIQYYRTDKKDFLYSILFVSALVAFTYFGLLFASLMEN